MTDRGSKGERAQLALFLPSSAMAAFTEQEIQELTAFFEITGITEKYMRREIIHGIRQKIERYGDDGMGDKPTDMSRIAYWAQHVDTEKMKQVAANLTPK